MNFWLVAQYLNQLCIILWCRLIGAEIANFLLHKHLYYYWQCSTGQSHPCAFHEGVWRLGDIAPLTLNCGSGWS